MKKCSTTSHIIWKSQNKTFCEINQRQKNKYCTIPLTEVPRIGKFIERQKVEGRLPGMEKGNKSQWLMNTECLRWESARNIQW